MIAYPTSELVCPTCDRAPGEPCRDLVSGQDRLALHDARRPDR